MTRRGDTTGDSVRRAVDAMQGMTPEQLARETGWSYHAWAEVLKVTGPHWGYLWRPIAELAGLSGKTPAQVARMLCDPDIGIIAAFDQPTETPR